jgi:hypothetical protein
MVIGRGGHGRQARVPRAVLHGRASERLESPALAAYTESASISGAGRKR